MDNSIVKDLALILSSASITALASRLFRFPLILGYMLVGLLTGPYTKIFFAHVGDPFSIDEWANLGVIFLLFTLGLEFDFKILKSEGKKLGLLTLFESLGSFLIIYSFAKFYLQWSHLISIFLAVAGSISSTSLILKTLKDRELTDKYLGKKVIGLLVFEDVVAIFSLVLLSSFIQSRSSHSGSSVLNSLFTFIAFLAAWLTLGFTLIPKMINALKKWIDDEILVVLSLGLCLAMVVAASEFGLSEGLGAFLTGLIFSRTELAHKASHLMMPIRDLFLAIFFVSIGMMIDIDLILPNLNIILQLSAVIFAAKFVITYLGSILFRNNIRDSLGIGLSMTQIGEFSFLIATLATTAKIAPAPFSAIIVGTSVLLSFTSPLLLKIYTFSKPYWRDQDWALWTVSFKPSASRTNPYFSAILRWILNALFIFIVLYLVIDILAVPILDQLGDYEDLLLEIKIGLILLLSPFFWNLVFYEDIFFQSKWTMILKMFLGLIISIILISQILPLSWAAPGAILGITLLGTFAARGYSKAYQWIETWFTSHFKE